MTVHVAEATEAASTEKREPSRLARLIRREVKSAAIVYGSAAVLSALAAIAYGLLT